MTNIRQIRLEEAPPLFIPTGGYSRTTATSWESLQSALALKIQEVTIVVLSDMNTIVAQNLQALSGDGGRLVLADRSTTEQSPMRQAYKKEKSAFERLLPGLLRKYQGQYVAVSGGTVVDADPNRVTLTQRFFRQHPDSPVFIALVSQHKRPSRIVTPFRRR